MPRQTLLTIYKSLVRPRLEYGDIIYDQPNNESFCQKLESYQYNAALAITGAIRGTSQTKIYKELHLKSLKFRRSLELIAGFRAGLDVLILGYPENPALNPRKPS